MSIRSMPTNDNYRKGWDRMHRKKRRKKMTPLELADSLSGVTDCHRGSKKEEKNATKHR